MAYVDERRAAGPLVIRRTVGRFAGPILALMIAASIGFVLTVGYQAAHP